MRHVKSFIIITSSFATRLVLNMSRKCSKVSIKVEGEMCVTIITIVMISTLLLLPTTSISGIQFVINDNSNSCIINLLRTAGAHHYCV